MRHEKLYDGMEIQSGDTIVLPKHSKARLWWSAKKHNIKWDTKAGDLARKTVMRLGLWCLNRGRKLLRWSMGRCSWCGRNCGFDSVISSKGLRCTKCQDHPAS